MDEKPGNEKINQNFLEIEKYLRHYYTKHPQKFIDVKSHLRELVNSTRLYEQTDNLEHLLRILKRRGLYNQHELTGLNVFKSAIKDDSFTALLTKQQNLLSSFRRYETSNIYADKRPTSNRNLSQQNPRRSEIYNEIANSLTPNEFLSFARCLKLGESEIREIELQNSSQRTRTLVLLDIFEQRNVPMKMLPKILSLIERDDLVSRLDLQFSAEINLVVAVRR